MNTRMKRVELVLAKIKKKRRRRRRKKKSWKITTRAPLRMKAHNT